MMINEGNRLIAKFMGLVYNQDAKGKWGRYWINDKNSDNKKMGGGFKELKYHSSWDWLIPVIEKIENNGCLIEIWFSVGIGCRIYKQESIIKSWQTVMENNSAIEAV